MRVHHDVKVSLRHPLVLVPVVAAMVLGLGLMPSMSASAAVPLECAPQQARGPLWITDDCVDPDYDQPVIDTETELAGPAPQHKVSGHFEGTDKRFNFYFPPKAQWQGRFYDKVYPTTDENAIADDLNNGADAGAYTVQTNAGTGYRVDAAAAKFSKTVAAHYYRWSGRIYGYIWGGSGGSFMTIGAIENSTGVWDGAVPFVVAAPTSIPNNYSVRAFARLTLQGKAPQIADAVRPGSGRSPYGKLNTVQRAALREVTRMGVPLRAWDDYHYLLGIADAGPAGPAGGTSDLFQFVSLVQAIDPTYADDFWTKPGYLGTQQSALGNVVRAALIDQVATVTQVTQDGQNVPTTVLLDRVPSTDSPVPLAFTATAADGTSIGTLSGALDRATKTLTIGAGNSDTVLNAISLGATVRIDNRWSSAFTTYYRHQVPARAGFTAWDQFRAPDGTPTHPQRPFEIGPLLSTSISGGTFTGHITGKVIIVDNLVDSDAFPWQADWYAGQVKRALGDRFNDTFRLWYNDHADHVDPHSPRLVNYGGMFKQALRDVAAWVETGVDHRNRRDITRSEARSSFQPMPSPDAAFSPWST